MDENPNKPKPSSHGYSSIPWELPDGEQGSQIGGPPSWIAPRVIHPNSELEDALLQPNQPPSAPEEEESVHSDIPPSMLIPSQRIPVSIRPREMPVVCMCEQLNQEVNMLRNQIAENVAQMGSMHRQIVESTERDVVRLALVIAERVIGREVRSEPSLIQTWVREALHALHAKEDATIALSPALADILAPEMWRELGHVIVDSTLEGLRCKVRRAESVVDIDVKSRLHPIASTLEEAIA